MAAWVETVRLARFEYHPAQSVSVTTAHFLIIQVGMMPSGDAPIVSVQSNGEQYLAARRLNDYDGEGWKSTITTRRKRPRRRRAVRFNPTNR